MAERDGDTTNVNLVSYRRSPNQSTNKKPPLPKREEKTSLRASRTRHKRHYSDLSSLSSSSEDATTGDRFGFRRPSKRSSSLESLSRFLARRSSSFSGDLSEQRNDDDDGGGVRLLSYRSSHSYGRGRVVAVMDATAEHSRVSSPHIPPPAGFDFPTRPSTLLAALIRGPVSLDETSLSPATQRRLAYIHRHTQSSFQIRSSSSSSDHKPANPAPAEGSSVLSKGEFWGDLPTSPLSPPSPFQHPFFRRQLGLVPAEPWARLSGFGFPRLNPMFRDPDGGLGVGGTSSSPRLSSSSSRPEDEESKCKGGPPSSSSVKTRHSRRGGKYHVSSTSSGQYFCSDSQSFKLCKETQFFSQTYRDGMSETESDDEEEEIFTTPVNCQKKLLLNNNHLENNNSNSNSSGEDVLPCSSTSPSSNNNSSNLSLAVGSSSPKLNPSHSSMFDMDIGSKRNSQAISSEADFDDFSSLTTSEPDSFHDAPSPRSSCHSPTYDEDKSSKTEPASQLDFVNSKLHKIVLELLNTERSYVNVLHIIDQEFQFRVDQESRAHHLFPLDQMPLMFANIKSIYKLHHDFLLPQLEERLTEWETDKRIGDIMKNFAPFLKMYTDYVRNFDNAMTLITNWQAKSNRFASIMDEIHNLKACGNLTLQHHMLSPVQRIPRYEMLLKDYLRKLPEDSLDRLDTEEALHLVSTAANHANDAMKKIDKFQKLLEVQECLGGAIELVSPTRELLKEGRIIKISARSGDHQERYLFLFSDLLLLCTPRLMGGRVMSGPQYRLRARYKVENLEVIEGDDLEIANTFYIRDSNKTVELYTQTKEEKEGWFNALYQAIEETYLRKSSLRLSSNSDTRASDPDLGRKQPSLIPTDSITKCMQCSSQFSVVRRKHHCRACGMVVCNKCSNRKLSLAYDCGKSVRVCQSCFDCLSEMESGVNTPPSTDAEDKEDRAGSRPNSMDSKKYENFIFKSRGVLEVSANASGSIFEGFLQLKTHRKAWVKRWFALHQDFVLYSFKTDEDNVALTATPVPGFTITKLQGMKGESGLSEKDREKAFKFYHAKKQYIFISPSKEDTARWVLALQKASRAELSSPVQ